MNDLDWQASEDPQELLRFLTEYEYAGKLARKMRLLAAGCCRLIWDQFFDRRSRAAIESVERLAAGPFVQRKLVPVRGEAEDVCFMGRYWYSWYHEAGHDSRGQRRFFDASLSNQQRAIALVAVACANPTNPLHAAENTLLQLLPFVDARRLANTVREVFGNPLTTPLIELGWRTRTVIDLARTIEAEQRHELQPFLGDALMDAGCEDTTIIEHCQQSDPHTRGCWLLDLLLVRG